MHTTPLWAGIIMIPHITGELKEWRGKMTFPGTDDLCAVKPEFEFQSHWLQRHGFYPWAWASASEGSRGRWSWEP